MKTLIYILLLAVLTFLSGVFLPQWWFVAVIGFALAMIFREGLGRTALITFLAVFLVWLGTAMYIDAGNDSILSGRIGNLFGGLSPFLLAAVTGLLGGLCALLGALTGASLSSTISRS